MKKVISLILSFIMVFGVSAGANIFAFADDNNTDRIYEYTQQNPVYQNLGQSSSAGDIAITCSYYARSLKSSETFNSVDDAAYYLKDCMTERQAPITVSIETYESDYQKLVKDIFDTAVDQSISTGSTDGDYLKLSCSGYSVKISYSLYSDGRYVYNLEYTVSYYTTAEQEQAIGEEIDRLIDEYGIDSKSDYAKVKTIHDIVCDRIKYDYDNMNDPNYKPQFTAYAALFDGKAVCQGYTLLFYRMAKEAGLDARIILGTNHAWNIVKVDGKYYEVDCTWDDTGYDNPNAADGDYWSSGHVIYDYFLRGSSDFYGHTRLDEYNTAEFNAQYPIAQSKYVCPHTNLIWVWDDGASCENGFTKTQICQNCEKVFDTQKIPAGNHNYQKTVVPPTENEKGYTEYECTVCGYSYIGEITDYASDNSALAAAIEQAGKYAASDYSAESFDALMSVFDKNEPLLSLSLPQTEIDKATEEILTAIYDLVPYLDLTVKGENGTVNISFDKAQGGYGKYSMLFGTKVTLSADAPDGYVFDGWYETVTKRIFSYDNEYTFVITSNTNIEARFIENSSATLTFANDSGQKTLIIDKTISQWRQTDSISSLEPKVPYKLGCDNGRWDYNEADVLAKLSNGEDVTITPKYDGTPIYPQVPVADGEIPEINLYYSLDEENSVGSFIMAAGIPDGCDIESIGIAFYYKKAQQFDPSDFDLTMSNKLMTGKFDSISPNGIYIVNITKLSSKYNWAAKGYITYYDESGMLKTAYSNQINIVDRNQSD